MSDVRNTIHVSQKLGFPREFCHVCNEYTMEYSTIAMKEPRYRYFLRFARDTLAFLIHIRIGGSKQYKISREKEVEI